MKVNSKLKRSINRYAHAEGLKFELQLKQHLLDLVVEYQQQGRGPDEILRFVSEQCGLKKD